MTLALFVLAALCTVDAPRSRTALPAEDGPSVAAIGAAATLGALVVVSVAADPFLDLVSVSAPTARIATGALLAVSGVIALATPPPPPTPAWPGRRAALVPVAFPVLLTPGLAALTAVGAVDHSPPVAVLVAAVALATLPALASVDLRQGSRARVAAATARGLSAVLLACGFALLFDGVFDI